MGLCHPCYPWLNPCGSQLDIIHLARISRGELVERVAFRLLDQRPADFIPDLFQSLAAAPVEIAAELEALPFHRHQNVVERNFLRRTRERVAAVISAPAGD